MSMYTTKSVAVPDSVELRTSSDGKDDLIVTPPPEFKGPEGFWTPEDLFSASISSCYILTFKGIAKFKKMDWESIEVKVEAQLEKTDSGYRFTKATIFPRLIICCKSNVDKYLEVLDKVKKTCLVTRSMNTEFILVPKIIVKAKK
ncbi:OsmC family protein [Halobacteriovorax sp. JY17]|uniref:OsmC family protein n=1 Tax=Halobacteriovorax sp. JY17 TaxID=2014617 RepID=UPI000C5E8815|nr:OsmC family protein [Halobacteriovorax sp. JY17]PIK16424.1 MAG: osmotically inducible protein OsmC [Halobacteriovorax sp. JY17]